MFALDARFATSFSAGLLAAVNPCGFVLLPTYLLYFLGMENLRPGAERSSIGRALAVSLSVSAGFISVFIVIGTLAKVGAGWFVDNTPYVSLVIGLLLVVLGTAMLFGYRLPFTTPKLDVEQRDPPPGPARVVEELRGVFGLREPLVDQHVDRAPVVVGHPEQALVEPIREDR